MRLSPVFNAARRGAAFFVGVRFTSIAEWKCRLAQIAGQARGQYRCRYWPGIFTTLISVAEK
jgi:hypothetical protein